VLLAALIQSARPSDGDIDLGRRRQVVVWLAAEHACELALAQCGVDGGGGLPFGDGELSGFFQLPYEGCDGYVVFICQALLQALDFGGDARVLERLFCPAPDAGELHFSRIVGAPVGFRGVSGLDVVLRERCLFWRERAEH